MNSSRCQITSLNVYRGKERVIKIRHDGFALSDRGTIEVLRPRINCIIFNIFYFQINRTILDYGIGEYLGELYRMNLSCSGDGLPENGCLFFKVLGTTNVTNGKIDSFI